MSVSIYVLKHKKVNIIDFSPYFMTNTGSQGKSMTSGSFMLDGLKYWFKQSPKFHGIGCGKQNYKETKRVGPFKDSPFGQSN